MWTQGFLGNDASFMLDVVIVALVALVPVQLVSLWLVKSRRNYTLHRNLQVALGAILLVAVLAFEIDVRLVHGGWEQIVNKQPSAPRLDDSQLQAVRQILYIHLVFAVSTPFFWVATLFLALKKFPRPPVPTEHSLWHRRLGWVSVIDLLLTSVTGIWFYVVAFVFPPAPLAGEVRMAGQTVEALAIADGASSWESNARGESVLTGELPLLQEASVGVEHISRASLANRVIGDTEVFARGTSPLGYQRTLPFTDSGSPPNRPFRMTDRRGVPDWEFNSEFPEDVFTFVRIRYNSWGGGRGKWRVDYPDSDLNISYRLQQLTSLRVNPDPIVLELTDPRLFDYPFIYIIEPGGDWGAPGTGLNLSPAEVTALRRYLDQGGFLMVDDFWGEAEWEEFMREMRKVFPDREPVDVPLEHPIFHCVYSLDRKPQIPAINQALQGRASGITWERPDAKEPHYRAIFDDNNRMMVFICHNTDLGDGWEREGENEWYFREFSEKYAYPLGINIIFYAMTH